MAIKILLDNLYNQIERANKTLRQTQVELSRQLAVAELVHASLLPKPIKHDRIHIDVRYLPIDQVGGDYCQVYFPDDRTCYITMCDVTGHGIPASLLATRVSSEVRNWALNGCEPKAIVQMLNDFIMDHFNKTSLFLSFVVARIDLEDRTITWSNAGHPTPLLVRRNDGKIDSLKSQNVLIGVLRDCLDAEPQSTLPLEPGTVFSFTPMGSPRP